MRFQPWGEKVRQAVVLSLRGYEGIFLQDLDVVLYRTVFQRELCCKLVQVARPVSDFVNYSCTVFTATRSAQEIPEQSSEFGVVGQ